MIIRNHKEIIEIYRGKTPIEEMYRGKVLVFQIIRSCYGKGYWINDAPFLNDDAWANE
jgi:hypothetical protein